MGVLSNTRLRKESLWSTHKCNRQSFSIFVHKKEKNTKYFYERAIERFRKRPRKCRFIIS